VVYLVVKNLQSHYYKHSSVNYSKLFTFSIQILHISSYKYCHTFFFSVLEIHEVLSNVRYDRYS